MTSEKHAHLIAYERAAALYLGNLRVTHPDAGLPTVTDGLPSLPSLCRQVNACGLTLRQFFEAVAAALWRPTWTVDQLVQMHGGIHPDEMDSLGTAGTADEPQDNHVERVAVRNMHLSPDHRAAAARYLRQRYEAVPGATTYALAAEFGLSFSKVYKLLKEAGAVMRRPGHRPGRHDAAAPVADPQAE